MEQAHVVLPLEQYDGFKEMERRLERNAEQLNDLNDKLNRAKAVIGELAKCNPTIDPFRILNEQGVDVRYNNTKSGPIVEFIEGPTLH